MFKIFSKEVAKKNKEKHWLYKNADVSQNMLTSANILHPQQISNVLEQKNTKFYQHSFYGFQNIEGG